MGAIVRIILNYLLSVVVTTAFHVFVLMGPGLILASLMNSVAWLISRQACRLMGVRLYLGLFGWLGTLVHELSHALFCLLFGHRIKEIKFFGLDPRDNSAGYVYHEFNSESLYQEIGNFFIGVGPIVIGTLVIYCASHFLLGPEVFGTMKLTTFDSRAFSSLEAVSALGRSIWDSIGAVIPSIFTVENLSKWEFYVFLYIAFSIGSSITLSKSDLRSALRGFILFVILLFLFNLTTLWLGRFADAIFLQFSQVYGIFYVIMTFAFIMNMIVGGIILLLGILFRRF